MMLRVWHERARVEDGDQRQCRRLSRKVVFARASVACREANSMARRERGKKGGGKKKNAEESQSTDSAEPVRIFVGEAF
ncbi:hypothetical protein [Achromobacter insuavis]|uniref:hypothetical protein n=1 Tax=Achromobacter insuavis TaxID=1287735 RepID=UPI001EEBE5B9|nr:hypothetical protein [Achromobacter insuavis]